MGVTSFDLSHDKTKLKTMTADFRLKCSICGEDAILIELGEKRFTVSSAIRSITIEYDNINEVKKYLEEKSYQNISDIIREKWVQKMGLDYFCSECNLIYCDDHCQVEINFDDGFYDDTHGTCPKGHKWCMDD